MATGLCQLVSAWFSSVRASSLFRASSSLPAWPDLSVRRLSELNSLNGSAAWVKFLRADNGDVFVQQRLPLSAVSVSSLALAIHAVGSCANDTEPMLAAMFGGFSAESDVPDVA